jgi:hypothetical protein
MRLGAAPWQSAACLACHAINASPENAGSRFAVSEGVSCEACHGPSEAWLKSHMAPDWRGLAPSEKARRGMHDTATLPGRLARCVECHVGAPGMVVDHEMLAAGHPPLTIAPGTLDERWARHAARRTGQTANSAERARAWLVGQALALRAELNLARDAAERGAWPEFARFDCADCHHDLAGTGDGKHPVGALEWGGWSQSLFGSLSEKDPLLARSAALSLAAAGSALRLGGASRPDVRDASVADAARAMTELCDQVLKVPLSAERLSAWMTAAAAAEASRPAPERDARNVLEAVRSTYLGLRALPGSGRNTLLERDLEAVRTALLAPREQPMRESQASAALAALRDRIQKEYQPRATRKPVR